MDTQAADWVWQKCAEIYGEQWVRENGEVPSQMWSVALNRLSQADVKAGVKAVIDKAIAWPPNLASFLELCSGVDCDAAFDRFIRKEPPESNAERITRQNKGYQCRNLWNEEKARKEWAKELKRNIEKERKGELRDPEQKLIAAHTQETEWDRKLRERIQSGKDKRRGG